MVAQNWIKALNTRLAETPSIGAKVGYCGLIVVLAVFAALFVLLALILKAANVVLVRGVQGLLADRGDNASDLGSDDAGFQHGSEGYGYYRNGIFQYPSMYGDDD